MYASKRFNTQRGNRDSLAEQAKTNAPWRAARSMLGSERATTQKNAVDEPGELDSILRTSEVVSFFTVAGRRIQSEAGAFTRPRNSLRAEFDDRRDSRQHIATKEEFFLPSGSPLPPSLSLSSPTPGIPFGVQRPWQLARGGANELWRSVAYEHVVISYARMLVPATIPEAEEADVDCEQTIVITSRGGNARSKLS